MRNHALPLGFTIVLIISTLWWAAAIVWGEHGSDEIAITLVFLSLPPVAYYFLRFMGWLSKEGFFAALVLAVTLDALLFFTIFFFLGLLVRGTVGVLSHPIFIARCRLPCPDPSLSHEGDREMLVRSGTFAVGINPLHPLPDRGIKFRPKCNP